MRSKILFLACCTVAFLATAEAASAGARRVEAAERFCESLGARRVAGVPTPLELEIRRLATALHRACPTCAATISVSGVPTEVGPDPQPLSIYCRQPCLGNCEGRAERAYLECVWPCSESESRCRNYCDQCEREYGAGACPGPCGVDCAAQWDECAEPCKTERDRALGACYDACCLDY